MLDKNEVIEKLWELEHNMSKRSRECRENAENAEQCGDNASANYWYGASDEDWSRAMGILAAIRAIEEM